MANETSEPTRPTIKKRFTSAIFLALFVTIIDGFLTMGLGAFSANLAWAMLWTLPAVFVVGGVGGFCLGRWDGSDITDMLGRL